MNRATVVIIDDEVETVDALKRLLKKEPYKKIYFTDAIEAMQYVCTQTVDVILTDQRMKGYTGLDIILSAKKYNPAISGVLMSGFMDFDVVVSAVNDGEILNYISKPFSEERLKMVLHQALVAKRERDEIDLVKQFKRFDEDQWQYAYEESVNQKRKDIAVIINALARLISAKDEELYDHSRRVGVIAKKIAKQMAIEATEIESIKLACLVHDLGKISLRDQIVYKDDKLDEVEYHEMKKHTTVGAEILRMFGVDESIVRIVEYHHERVDGRGYPKGLSGENIPLGAKIVSVADAFDAMTSDRVYRRGMSVEETWTLIQKAAGTIYEERVVEALHVCIVKKLLLDKQE